MLHKLGYKVIPLYKNKKAAISDWPRKATATPPEDWDLTWYGVLADNFIVIDVDIKDGKPGFASLKRLKEKYRLPKTMSVKSQSGGLHLYYKCPNGIRNGVEVIIEGESYSGVDIRASGKGYVVGPGSPGYELKNEPVGIDELASLPLELYQALTSKPKPGLKIKDASELITTKDIPDIIPKGQRDITLFEAMASWRGRGWSLQEAAVQLRNLVDRCEGNVSYDEYYEKLQRTYDNLECNTTVNKQWMLENLVYVKAQDSVYDLSDRVEMKVMGAANAFKNVLDEDEEGKRTEVFRKWQVDPKRLMVQNLGYKPVPDKMITCGVTGHKVINTYYKPDLGSSEGGTHTWFEDLVTFLWQENAQTALDYCAHIIQKPDVRMTWSCLLITPAEGMGKDAFFEALQKMVGVQNAAVVAFETFSRDFHDFLVGSHVVLLNELELLSKINSRKMMGKLKKLITAPFMTIEPKGRKTYTSELFTNFFMFSNSDDVLDIDYDARRFFVHINRENPRDAYWYQTIYQLMENPANIAATYEWLKARDISKFIPIAKSRAPDTDHKRTLVENVQSALEARMLEDIELGNSIFVSDIITRSALDAYNDSLPSGFRGSGAHLANIAKKRFERLRYEHNGQLKPKQYSLPKVIYQRDEDDVEKGKMEKVTAWTCRNHEDYDCDDIKRIKQEFEKIFDKKRHLHIVES